MNNFINQIKKLFFHEVFIGVNIFENECSINIDITKNGKIKTNIKKVLIVKDHTLSDEAKGIIQKYITNYNFTYVTTMLNTTNQGAITGCGKEALQRFNIIAQDVNALCIDNKWQAFAYLEDINLAQNSLDGIDVDYIISPFVVISFLIKELHITETTLYVLNQKESVSIAIFDSNTLLFSAHIKSNKDVVVETKETISSIDEDPIDNFIQDEDDDMDFFEDDEEFEDMALDEDEVDTSINDEIKEKSIDSEDTEEKSKYEEAKERESQYEIKRSMELLAHIKNSITEFYKSEIYESDFINKVVIATDEKLSSHVCEFIEDEILIDIELININLSQVLSKIAFEETKSYDI